RGQVGRELTLLHGRIWATDAGRARGRRRRVAVCVESTAARHVFPSGAVVATRNATRDLIVGSAELDARVLASVDRQVGVRTRGLGQPLLVLDVHAAAVPAPTGVRVIQVEVGRDGREVSS